MLRELLLWWLSQMRACVPARLRAGRDRVDALLITVAPSRLALAVRRRGRERALGEAPMEHVALAGLLAMLRRRPRRVVLRLPATALLERPVELPLAAERDLHRVLAYDMDRLTPFPAAEIVWQAAILQRDAARRRLRLNLALVPRQTLAPVLQVLSRAGLAADRLEITGMGGARRHFPLSDIAADRIGGRLLTALSAATGGLALATVLTPFIVQSLALRSTDHAIATLARRVAQVEALRRHQATWMAGADALAAERGRIGDVLQVLAATTDVVPDNAWLTELSLHQGRLRISGQSPAAARLIPALAEDRDFRNPAFVAPVTRAPDGHADLFVIRADLAR
jgi:general secretion pathway protein L